MENGQKHIFIDTVYTKKGQADVPAFKTIKTRKRKRSPAWLIGYITNPYLNVFVTFKLIAATIAMNISRGNNFPVILRGIQMVPVINPVVVQDEGLCSP